jgi:predicted nucleic acid-binding protein
LSFVLDNSVALAWCFEDEQTPAVLAVLDRLVEGGASAPVIWPLEAANGLLMAERRGRVDGARRVALTGFLHRLPVLLDVATAYRAWDESLALAARHGLSVYDATYLELALRLGLPLATLDRDLRKAGAAHGIALLGRDG